MNIITNTNVSNPRCQADEYDPWGAVSKGDSIRDPLHRFTGQELDPETGIYYYGARYDDPNLQRFVSPHSFVQEPDNPRPRCYARREFLSPLRSFVIVPSRPIGGGGSATGVVGAAGKQWNELRWRRRIAQRIAIRQGRRRRARNRCGRELFLIILDLNACNPNLCRERSRPFPTKITKLPGGEQWNGKKLKESCLGGIYLKAESTCEALESTARVRFQRGVPEFGE